MTIIFAGGEDSDFTRLGAGTVDTATTAARDTAKARCSLRLSSATVTDSWVRQLSTPLDLFWLTAREYFVAGNGVAYVNNNQWVSFYDGTVLRLYVSFVNGGSPTGTGFYQLVKRNAAGTNTVLSVSSALKATAAQVKVDIFVDYQVAGNVKVYLDGTLIINYSGDVTTDSATDLSAFGFGQTICTAGNLPVHYWSEVILTDDEDTRSLRLNTLPVDADGVTTDWTGTFADVDETTYSDSDVNSSGSVNQVQQYEINTAGLTGAPQILALIVSARIQKGVSGPQNIQAGVRTGGADFFGATAALAVNFENFQHVFEENPDTTNPWEASEITNAGFNIALKSIT